MSSIVRAVDVGFGNVKYTEQTRGDEIACDHFPSLVYRSVRDTTAEGLGGRRRTVAIPIDGIYFEVGPEVHLAADAHRPSHLHDRFTESPEYLALLRGALHFMKVDRIDSLVIGLPVADFLSRRAALERLALGEHDTGRGRKVLVKAVRVVAQPQGALAHYAAAAGKLRQLQDQQSLVIDVGARTFDWLVARGLRLVPKKSGSANRGASDVIRALAEQISMDLGIRYGDLDAIDAAIRKRRPLSIFQRPYPLDKLEPIANAIADQAVSEMLQSVGDLHSFEHIVLAGGGAFLFQKAIRKAFAKCKVQELREPIYANVRGYQLAGMDELREKEERATKALEARAAGGEASDGATP